MLDAREEKPRHKAPRPDRRGRLSLRELFNT